MTLMGLISFLLCISYYQCLFFPSRVKCHQVGKQVWNIPWTKLGRTLLGSPSNHWICPFSPVDLGEEGYIHSGHTALRWGPPKGGVAY